MSSDPRWERLFGPQRNTTAQQIKGPGREQARQVGPAEEETEVIDAERGAFNFNDEEL